MKNSKVWPRKKAVVCKKKGFIPLPWAQTERKNGVKPFRKKDWNRSNRDSHNFFENFTENVVWIRTPTTENMGGGPLISAWGGIRGLPHFHSHMLLDCGVVTISRLFSAAPEPLLCWSSCDVICFLKKRVSILRHECRLVGGFSTFTRGKIVCSQSRLNIIKTHWEGK